MKKILCMVLSMIMMVLFTACGSSSGEKSNSGNVSSSEKKEVAASPAPEQKGNNKTLVVYFSCTGNTKTLAENAAKALQADIFAIQPEQPYTNEDLNYNDKSTRASVEQNDAKVRPKIKNKVENIEKYDTIVLAYPIWWGQEPRIMDTFMENYDFSGKTMAAICTSGGSDIGRSDAALAELGSKNAKWKEGRQFSARASVEDLGQWFKQIGLLK